MSHSADPGHGPLAGLRIVEFAGLGPVPFAGMLLSDMGADIVRIDRPGTVASVGPEVIGRGRRIVAVDLREPGAIEMVLALTEQADAVLEGFRPGVLERLGLGPEILLAGNPRLVIGRMTGWGQGGPLAQAAGHDLNYIALTGALAAIGQQSRPVVPLNLVGDYGGGAMYLVMGVLAGIIAAKASGRGQVIDCAMCDGAASLMSAFYEMGASGQWSDRREANIIDGGAYFYGVFACSDGTFVSVAAIEPQFYAILLDRLGLHDDPAFTRQNDRSCWPALRERMQAIFRSRTRTEWCALLEGTDACFAPVMTLAEAPNHPHLAARGTFTQWEGTAQPDVAPRFYATPSKRRPSRRDQSLADIIGDWRTDR